MNNLLANINPTVFSWSAVIIGTIICEELNAVEQSSVGNWLVLLGDYLLTNSAQIAVLQDNNQSQNQMSNDDKIQMLEQVICRIEQELKNLQQK